MRTNLIILFSFIFFSSCITNKMAVKQNNDEKDMQIAKNVIFVIVDGMGFSFVKAARIYKGLKPLSFENFPCQTSVSTCSREGTDKFGNCLDVYSEPTDSAAGATAIATGLKVNIGAVGKDIRHEPKKLTSILEILKKEQKSTGIIANKLISDATPASFASHANNRMDLKDILASMFNDVKPNLIFGADNKIHRNFAKKSSAPYIFIHSAKELKGLSRRCKNGNCPYVYGGFGTHKFLPEVDDDNAGLLLEINPQSEFNKFDMPHLSEMTEQALKILSQNKKGFFLMVESSMPDMIAHYNYYFDKSKKYPKAIGVLVREMLEVERTINVIEKFRKNNPDTLVVLTADHETGGLVIDEKNTACLSKERCIPKVKWTADKYTNMNMAKHTKVNVPLYATGVGAKRFCRQIINNTEIKGLALNE